MPCRAGQPRDRDYFGLRRSHAGPEEELSEGGWKGLGRQRPHPGLCGRGWGEECQAKARTLLRSGFRRPPLVKCGLDSQDAHVGGGKSRLRFSSRGQEGLLEALTFEPRVRWLYDLGAKKSGQRAWRLQRPRRGD